MLWLLVFFLVLINQTCNKFCTLIKSVFIMSANLYTLQKIEKKTHSVTGRFPFLYHFYKEDTDPPVPLCREIHWELSNLFSIHVMSICSCLLGSC